MKKLKKRKIIFAILFCAILISVTPIEASASVTRRNYNVGGLSLGKFLNVTYYGILNTFDLAIDDGRYLGVPYFLKWKLDDEGMNCEGFIYEHLRSSGANEDRVQSMIGRTGTCPGWYAVIRNNNIEYSTYTGSSWNELCNYIVKDGLIQPGDIIWMWDGPIDPNDGFAHKLSDYHHIAFYVGDYYDYKNVNDPYWQKLSGTDSKLRIWHSTGETPPEMGVRSGNVTTRMYGMAHTTPCSISVFPMHYGPLGLKIVKKSSDPTITDGNELYTLNGAQYDIFSDAQLTQKKESLVTNTGGVAFSHVLSPGTYYIKETKAPENYRLDPNVYSVTISKNSQGFVVVNVTGKPVIMKGRLADINDDGSVNIFDCISLMQLLAEGDVQADENKYMDVDANGSINVFDCIEFISLLAEYE